MLVTKDFINDTFQVGERYFRACVRDFEYDVLDDDFPRFTEIQESLEQAIKQTDEDFDDFSDCYIFITEYVRMYDELDECVCNKAMRVYIDFYGELKLFKERINGKWKFNEDIIL